MPARHLVLHDRSRRRGGAARSRDTRRPRSADPGWRGAHRSLARRASRRPRCRTTIASGSRVAVASSTRISGGASESAATALACRRNPRESVPSRWPRRFVEAECRHEHLRASGRADRRHPRGRARARRAPSRSARRSRSARPGRAPTRHALPASPPALPATVIVPASIESRPAAAWSSVVLPEPFGPTSPTTAPARTSRSTPSRAGDPTEALADAARDERCRRTGGRTARGRPPARHRASGRDRQP